ncbi:DUF2254 domain-containing protein [Nocardia sp. 004]|uniref:DUF2254 domain-containing protein n=1 Tax=Nocardia sp. 004 TaxID=3385978 RepID=UPI0039A3B670
MSAEHRPGSRPIPQLREMFRAQLWPLPTLGIALAIAAGAGLPRLDEHIQQSIPPGLADYLFSGSADAARTMLEVIAGSLITVTALTFSLTVLTLQLASSQFSPRLLRTFTSDRYVQTTLAFFLGTFTYALTVLRTIRNGTDEQAMFVPQVSVTLAFLLTLASVLALVLFLSHLAREIRVEAMMRSVHAAADHTIRQLLPTEDTAAGNCRGALPAPPAGAVALPADTSGFLSSVNESALLRAAVEADAVVLIDRYPGSSLIAGTPMGAAWTRTGEPFSAEVRTRLLDSVARAVVIGPERTDLQDIAFGLRQLTDVAVRALSPAINDPTTAVHALSYSSALLCELARRDPGSRLLCDDQHRTIVELRRPDLQELLDLVVDQPLRYGATEPAVLIRIAILLRELAWACASTRQQPVAAALARLRSVAAAQDLHPLERSRITEQIQLIEQAMAGHWPYGRSC